jgi:hypothetical protein
MSCNILLTREAVKPCQTDQKYLAAVPDLGNIAEQSAMLHPSRARRGDLCARNRPFAVIDASNSHGGQSRGPLSIAV